MTLTYQTPSLPPNGASPVRLANAVNQTLEGKLNCKGEVTITASVTTTAVTDRRAATESVILLMPLTANAAAALATTFVSTRADGSFTLTHANNAQTDRDFAYVIIG